MEAHAESQNALIAKLHAELAAVKAERDDLCLQVKAADAAGKLMETQRDAALERCGRLEWLVEVTDFWFTYSEPWGPRKAYYTVSYKELHQTWKAARAAMEGKK